MIAIRESLTLAATWSVVLFLVPAHVACAETVPWKISDGGNGHSYGLVDSVSIPWDDAQASAVSRGGYLATITSANENDFVVNVVGHGFLGMYPNYYLLGGFQPTNETNSNANWQWVTGEPWSFTSWALGEPNDGYGGPASEQFVMYDEGKGKWNDIPQPYGAPAGYIVEFNFTIPEPGALVLITCGLALGSFWRGASNVATIDR